MESLEYYRRVFRRDVLDQYEGLRFKFQTQAEIEAAATILKAQNLARLSDFDRRRAATMPELSLEFSARTENTPEQDQYVAEMISKLPPFLKTMLTEFDTAFWTGRTAKDVSQKLADHKSEGLEGKTVEEQSAGAYIGEARIIGMFNKVACKPQENCRLQTIRAQAHETGHAVDRYLGFVSRSPEFQKAYEADMKLRRPEIPRQKLQEGEPKEDVVQVQEEKSVRKESYFTYFKAQYFRTKADDGFQSTQIDARREAFGELFGDYLNKRLFAKDPDFKHVVPLSSSMPNCAKYIENLMADVERYYQIAPKPLVPVARF